MNSSTKKEARLFNLMKKLRDRKKKQKRKKKRKKKNLLSFQGPSPLVCPIIVVLSPDRRGERGGAGILWQMSQ
jgi:hypothetical protein